MTPHEKLLKDLVSLTKDAAGYSFHCFKGESATPKVDLVQRLHTISENAKTGVYDDDADKEDIAAMKKVCEEEGMPEEVMKMLGFV